MADNRKSAIYIKGKRLSERAAFIINFVAKFRQCRFFSDKRCKVWYDTYKRGSVFTDPGRNSILYPVSKNVIPVGMRKQ